MKHFSVQTARGEAMLITVLILGVVTLGFILVGLATTAQESETGLVIENKMMASSAAIGCAEQAIDRLGLNVSYTGNETLSVGAQTCTIRPVLTGSGTWTIETSAQVGQQYARYRVVLTGRAPVVVSSWTEVATF